MPDAGCLMKRVHFFISLEGGGAIMPSTIAPRQSWRARHIAAMLISISGTRKTMSLQEITSDEQLRQAFSLND